MTQEGNEGCLVDLGRLSARHRTMLLTNTLKTQGLDALKHTPKVYPNEYREIDPELVYGDEPDVSDEGLVELGEGVSCRILIHNSFTGLLVNPNFISTSDKLETQMTIVTDILFNIGDRFVVTFPDGMKFTLRVSEKLTLHPFSQVISNGMAVLENYPGTA